MSDYSTSTVNSENRYTDDEIIEGEIVGYGTADDETQGAPEPVRMVAHEPDLVIDEEKNPIALLAYTFPQPEKPLADNESAFTREEAEKGTQALKVKILHMLEAQYECVSGLQDAFYGHIWVALDYPEGMKGWRAYCADNLTAETVRITGRERADLITGFDPDKISGRAIAVAFGMPETTVRRIRKGTAKPKAIVGADGIVRPVNDLSPRERQELDGRIYDMSKIQGLTQVQIAEQLGLSQSTVSASIAREHARRMSEGLLAAEAPDLSEFDSDEVIDTSTQILEQDETNFVNAVSGDIDNAALYLDQLVKDMQDDMWRPGSMLVSRILDKSNENLMQIYDSVCMLMRLHSRQSTRLYGDPDMQDRLVDEFGRVMQVAEDAANWED